MDPRSIFWSSKATSSVTFERERHRHSSFISLGVFPDIAVSLTTVPALSSVRFRGCLSVLEVLVLVTRGLYAFLVSIWSMMAVFSGSVHTLQSQVGPHGWLGRVTWFGPPANAPFLRLINFL